MVNIGFLSNKLTLRGTEIAMYDYADFNETLLKNKSVIITRDYNKIQGQFDVSSDAYAKFQQRFTVEYYQSQQDIDNIVEKHNLTHLYIIKAGSWDGLASTKCKNLIHCVFVTSQPHGQVYSVISDEVNRLHNTNYPVVPHMIRNFETNEHLRRELAIPENATVFGRYGGMETFDIDFVHTAVQNVLNARDDVYYIFMNTTVFYKHPRVIYLQGTTNMEIKRKFINTSDALLHARRQGETFGLTCGEFAMALKPVITYEGSKEKNHIGILRENAVLYSDYNTLYNILYNFNKTQYTMDGNGYFSYSPENVMKLFEKIFLSE